MTNRMIRFDEAALYSLIPENLKSAETAALSAALEKGLEMIRTYSAAVSIYASIPELPDDVLNLLALEMRVQYYDAQDSRESRETILRNTFSWYLRGGTGSVLQEYLAAQYQGGQLEEWFEYGGQPYYFRSVVDLKLDDEILVGDGQKVLDQINAYKNVRSWLESFSFHIGIEYLVPISYQNAIRFRTEFYPRYNLGYLHLDGTWRLDGTRRLSGYDSDEVLDFYPVGLRLNAGSAAQEITAKERLQITAGVEALPETGNSLRVQAQARTEPETEQGLRFCSGAALLLETRSYMTKQNRLDGAWKLDGSRKLDGGKQEL